jgi:hypothetical protein
VIPLKIKIPSKNLGRQRCEDVFISGPKGLSVSLKKVLKMISFKCHIRIMDALFIALESSASVLKINDIMNALASVH